MTRVLWANFGGEEGLPPRQPNQPERFVGEARLAEAFASLFVEGAPFADATGFIAWFNNVPASQMARTKRLPLFGAPPEVVARVHDKAFVVEASATTTILDASEVSDDSLQLARKVAGPTAVVKARMSTSGRGRIGHDQLLTPRVIARMRQQGGCIIEPWWQRIVDLSSLWRIHDDRLECLAQTVAEVDDHGVFRGSRLVRDGQRWRSGTTWDEELHATAQRFVRAAVEAGLRGPCGVDAFVHRGVDGEQPPRLHVCELNARFTVGMIAAAQALSSTSSTHLLRLGSG